MCFCSGCNTFEIFVTSPTAALIRHLWIAAALEEQNPIPAMYSLSSAITLCAFHFLFFIFQRFPPPPFLLQTCRTTSSLCSPKLLLIRPWSQILIPARVKTPFAIKIGWQLIFLGGLQKTIAVMELFFFFFQSVTSLTHWNKDNVELFALSCNYADSLTFSLTRSLSVFSFHLPY